jgi:hypothetical protein
MQRQRKHTYITIEELLGYGVLYVISLRGPCRSFIWGNESRLQSVVKREAECGETSAVKVSYGL